MAADEGRRKQQSGAGEEMCSRWKSDGTVRDHPPINPCSHAEQQGSGTVLPGALGISDVVQQLFETSVKVTPHKTIYRVNIIPFTAVLPLLINGICSTTNYDGN